MLDRSSVGMMEATALQMWWSSSNGGRNAFKWRPQLFCIMQSIPTSRLIHNIHGPLSLNTNENVCSIYQLNSMHSYRVEIRVSVVPTVISNTTPKFYLQHSLQRILQRDFSLQSSHNKHQQLIRSLNTAFNATFNVTVFSASMVLHAIKDGVNLQRALISIPSLQVANLQRRRCEEGVA